MSYMLRVLALVYWLVSYVVAVLTLVYLVGFIGNRYSPSTIDSGLQIPEWEAAMADLKLLLLFALQHSLMARRWWKRMVPAPIERSTYLLATGFILAAIYRYWEPIPRLLWSVEATASLLLSIGFATGWALAVWATVAGGHLDSFGFRQVWAYVRGEAHQPPPIRTRAPFRWVRHPTMLGLLLAFWSEPRMSWGHVLFSAVMTAYILIALRFEERDLARTLGAEYERYRARTGMLFPRL